VLAPVAYRAATRAMGYAADALDRAGIQHGLRGMVITDTESARVAERAAAKAERAAWAAQAAALAAARADVEAAEAAWAAAWAATRAAAEDAVDAEHKLCADDCRELLPELRIEI